MRWCSSSVCSSPREPTPAGWTHRPRRARALRLLYNRSQATHHRRQSCLQPSAEEPTRSLEKVVPIRGGTCGRSSRGMGPVLPRALGGSRGCFSSSPCRISQPISARGSERRSLVTRPGDVSYGVYVYAFPAEQAAVHLLGTSSILLIIGVAGVPTYLLAWLSWRYVERPCSASSASGTDSQGLPGVSSECLALSHARNRPSPRRPGSSDDASTGGPRCAAASIAHRLENRRDLIAQPR